MTDHKAEGKEINASYYRNIRDPKERSRLLGLGFKWATVISHGSHRGLVKITHCTREAAEIMTGPSSKWTLATVSEKRKGHPWGESPSSAGIAALRLKLHRLIA